MVNKYYDLDICRTWSTQNYWSVTVRHHASVGRLSIYYKASRHNTELISLSKQSIALTLTLLYHIGTYVVILLSGNVLYHIGTYVVFCDWCGIFHYKGPY